MKVAAKGWLAAIAMVLMVFAQYAIALEQCDGLMQDEGCVTHCVAQDQQLSSLDQPLAVLPAVPAAAPPDFALAGASAAAAPVYGVPLPEGPPLRVLFCSYLI